MCCCLCDLEVRSVSFLNVHGISRDIYHILEESVPPSLFCFMPDIFIACISVISRTLKLNDQRKSTLVVL
jgi:hypothetical protein